MWPHRQACRNLTTADTAGAVKFDFNPEVRALARLLGRCRSRLAWTAAPA
jgi:hypothetical protein